MKGSKKKELHEGAGCGGKEQPDNVAASVQSEVLPRYGFRDGEQGIARMWQAVEPLAASDPLLKELAEAVRCELQRPSRLAPAESGPQAPSAAVSGPKFQAPQETVALQGLGYARPVRWVQRRLWVTPRIFAPSSNWAIFVDLPEGMTVRVLRKQLLSQIKVLALRLRLQEWAEGKLRDLEDTASADRATAMYLPHAPLPAEQADCGPPFKVPKAQLIEMQKEALERFGEPEFQKKLRALISKHRNNITSFGSNSLFWSLPGRSALVDQVNKDLLPKYGLGQFLGNPQHMAAVYEPYLQDLDLIYPAELVNERLALPPQFYDLRQLTF
uniref:Protein C10 n=1 Tax=Pyrodinium bahamense TaxID=73915 RepID=A0A7S0FJ03_9DINO